MVQIDDKLTRRIAQLANLELTEQEVTSFTSQLGNILGYIDQLAKAEVADIEPMTHPIDLPTALREDVVRPSPTDAEGRPRVLESAPEVLHDGFKVPPVL